MYHCLIFHLQKQLEFVLGHDSDPKVEQESHKISRAFSINIVRLKRLDIKMGHIRCCHCKSELES